MASLDALDAAYESAEAAYLQALRDDAPRPDLGRLAVVVASAAQAWNTQAYEALHAVVGPDTQNLDWLTERTEVLSELWADVAAAYGS